MSDFSKATPGPWLYRGKSDSVHAAPTPEEYAAGYRLGQFIFRFDDEGGPSDDDLALILAAPQLAADLVAAQQEIARLRAALENLRASALEDPLSQKPSDRALKSAFSLLDTK